MTIAQEKGKIAERRAESHLVEHGLRILARNYRVRGGEIDLIADDRGIAVFIEVRYRGRMDFGGAAASIDRRKRARIVLAARHWLARYGECLCRFDCLVIDGERLEWLRDAFPGD